MEHQQSRKALPVVIVQSHPCWTLVSESCRSEILEDQRKMWSVVQRGPVRLRVQLIGGLAPGQIESFVLPTTPPGA